MSLRFRLALSLIALVAISLGATAGWLYRRTSEDFARRFEADVAAVRGAVGDRFQRDAEALRARLEALAGDPRLLELLEDAGRGRLESDPKARRRATESIEAVLASSGLDALWVVTRGEPIRGVAAGHVSVDSPLPAGTLRLVRDPTGHRVALEGVRRGGRVVTLPTLEVAAVRGEFALVLGRVLGGDFASDLRPATGSAEVAVADPSGKFVAATFPGEPPTGCRTAVVPLEGVGAGFTVQIFVSEAPLREQLRALEEATLVGVGTASVLAVVFALLIAVRLSRPLRALARAARRIADGERDVVLVRRASDAPAGDRDVVLLTRTDEIGAVNEAFAAMAQDLAESEGRLRQAERIAAWQDIARELAHEIKNPLTPIQMAVETLKRTYERRPERFGEIFPELTATVLEEVERLKHIVSEFSAFARLPASELREGSLNDVVRRSVQLYDGTCPSGLTLALGWGVDPVRLDADRMTQLVQNLVKNAIEATTGQDRPVTITVTTRAVDDRHVELVVEDNGPGIREDDQARVFTPYFTRRAGGSGLGLAVVSRVAAEHGGTVALDSTPGVGTRFTVRIRRGGGEG